MSTRVGAVVQARMGSTRLPGKVMLPLADKLVIQHDVQRAKSTPLVDSVAVATSDQQQDDVISQWADRNGVIIHRGSESDVLGRMYGVARQLSLDVVVRITGDCPLIDPETIDAVTREVTSAKVDYAANILQRTFPRGLDVEAFTFESFERVHEEATQPHHREHVTPYYRENPDEFDLVNVTSDEVFDNPRFHNRDDLRLTLDEADDYEVLREIYENVPYDDILPVRDAVKYVDENNLMELNESIEQKEL